MPVTYSTRTAVQQAIITLRIGTRSQLSAAFGNGAFTSTYGRNVFLENDYSGAPASGSAINFSAAGNVNVITVDRSTLDNTFANGGQIAIGDNIFSLSGNSVVGPNVIFDCAKTPMSISGATVETRASVSIVADPGPYNQFFPISSALDNAGVLRAVIAGNYVISDPPGSDPLGGDLYMINVTLMTALIQPRWQGLDLTISGYGVSAWRPKDNASGNWGLFSGVYINTDTQPLLIDANLDGTENARYRVALSDPVWNAVWSQPPGSANIMQLLPCNVGWYGTMNVNTVTPPSFIVLNEDMTKYWVYVIEAEDPATNAAIFTSGWGNSFFEGLWISSILTDQGTPGIVQILGAVGNPSLLMQNIGEANLGRLLLDNWPTIISGKCVPCAPVQFDQKTGWQPRYSLIPLTPAVTSE